jgi:hypothetical protein
MILKSKTAYFVAAFLTGSVVLFGFSDEAFRASKNSEEIDAEQLKAEFVERVMIGKGILEPIQETQKRVLILFDGDEQAGYDPYNHRFFSGGPARLNTIQNSYYHLAMNVRGFEQMSLFLEALSAPYRQFDRIYIVDHGNVTEGKTLQTLGEEILKPEQFEVFNRFLTPDGDICLYGCDVGTNVEYVIEVSKAIKGRRVWAYADELFCSVDDVRPLKDPESEFFFAFPTL